MAMETPTSFTMNKSSPKFRYGPSPRGEGCGVKLEILRVLAGTGPAEGRRRSKDDWHRLTLSLSLSFSLSLSVYIYIHISTYLCIYIHMGNHLFLFFWILS